MKLEDYLEWLKNRRVSWGELVERSWELHGEIKRLRKALDREHKLRIDAATEGSQWKARYHKLRAAAQPFAVHVPDCYADEQWAELGMVRVSHGGAMARWPTVGDCRELGWVLEETGGD